MQLKKLFVPFDLKEVSESGEFEGYGSVFGVKDHGWDIVMPGAFADSLTAWKAKGKFPPVLWQHDTREPIGPHTDMYEDEKGLFCRGRLLIDADPVAKRAHAHMKAGSVTGLSIGYTLPEGGYEWSREKQAYLLHKVDLWEVSVVTFAMNEEASVTAVKSRLAAEEVPSAGEVESALVELGLTPAQAKAFMGKGYSAISALPVTPTASGAAALKTLLDRIPV